MKQDVLMTEAKVNRDMCPYMDGHVGYNVTGYNSLRGPDLNDYYQSSRS